MNVGFLIRKTRTNKYSVCCRITFGADKAVHFSVKGVTLEKKENWINNRGEPLQILGAGAKKKMLILNELELELIEILERQKALNYPVTASIIKALYLGDTKPSLTAVNVFREFIDKKKQKSKNKKTQRQYELYFEEFERFCKAEKIVNIPAENFTVNLAKKYFDFLLTTNIDVTAWRKVRTVKTALNLAFEDEKIKETKVSTLSIAVKNKKKPFVFLLQDELERIENKRFDIERLENVRLMFLFCCYTGFHFNQMQIFNAKEHLFEQNEKKWISTERDKNGNYIGIPVFPKTLAILEKFNYKLPIISNGNFNAYLKEIADFCQIRKNLTSKVGRKTFANIMINVHGVSKSVVARMLGHDSVTTTEKHYGDIDQNSIIRETEHLF